MNFPKRFGLVLIAAAVCFAASNPATGASDPSKPPRTEQQTALYAAIGAQVIHYDLSIGDAVLVKRESVEVPGNIQYLWPHPDGRHLYVASSGAAGEAPTHTVTAFAIEPHSGALHQLGESVALKYRPIHLTTDRDGTHLLVITNIPPSVTVFSINPDGGIGPEIKQSDKLDLGVYIHQVRVEPSNRTVVIVARGNYEATHEPGALKFFDYQAGVLQNRTSIAPYGGVNFNPRHLDFDLDKRWAFVTLEAQNLLDVFQIMDNGTFRSTPLFSKSTLAVPSDIKPEYRQLTGTVHMHPNGRFVYVANRGTGTIASMGKQIFSGGKNNIAVFAVDQKTGEPTLIQNADTHGMIPRTFSIDTTGRILIAGNQDERLVREGQTLTTVPRRITVFRIREDGKLDFARSYDVDDKLPGTLFWLGMLPVPQ